MADIDYEKLADAVNKGKGGGGSIDAGPAGDALKKFTEPLKKATQYVEDSTGAFNKLSQTGNSFNNDIIGMKVAAANTRMSFDDFAGMMTKNNGEVGKSFAGLGGSVAKGGQAFTEFSKTFFDSGVAENLRQMGYTSKDLNEVLANQIGFQKSTTDTSVAGQVRTAQAAADLANEMDLIAKQTGKTRKEQEAALEKAKGDGQIEAKMRLIGLQQGAEAEKAAREGFAKQLAQAEAMGTGQVFKEMFATGTVRSQEAAMQMGLLGEAARGTAESAKALSKGNVEASQASMETAKVGNLANQKNVALLNITASGVGPAADVMKKNIESNDAAYHGAAKTAKAMGLAMEDTVKVLGAQKKAIQDEQNARHGATAAMITVQGRLQDAAAAVANKVVAPLNKGEINKAGLKFSESASQGVKAGDTAKDTAGAYKTALENQAKMGGATQAPASAREKIEAVATQLGVDKAVQATDKVVGGALQGAGSVALKATNFVGDAMKVYNMNQQAIPTRDEGTLGKTGQPFEPADFIGKVAKGEMVLTPDQAQKFMMGAKTDGMASAVQEMAKSMPKMKSDAGSLDLSGIAKQISTSVSAAPGASSVSSTEKAQAAIDEAIKKKEEAQERLNKLWNEGSDEELNEQHEKLAEELKAAKENLTSVIDASMGDLTSSFDDVGSDFETSFDDMNNSIAESSEESKAIQKEASSALASKATAVAPKEKPKFQMPGMGQLTIGPDGMPKISAKAQADSIPAAAKAAETKTETTKPGETKPAETTTSKETADKKPGTTKESSQDDLAKMISSLNTTMNKVYNSIEGMSSKISQQVKATKAMSGNAHDRT